jgi:hypothetical protein
MQSRTHEVKIEISILGFSETGSTDSDQLSHSIGEPGASVHIFSTIQFTTKREQRLSNLCLAKWYAFFFTLSTPYDPKISS